MGSRQSRGFTLIELMSAMSIVAILSGMAIWQVQRTVPAYRAADAAAHFIGDMRNASSIAARINEPVRLTVSTDGTGACKTSWKLEATRDGRIFDSVCLDTEYPGVTLVQDHEEIACKEELDRGIPPLPTCSLCNGGSVLFLPSGEARAATGEPPGDSLVFAPANDPRHNIRAVGVRTGSGRVRTYREQGGAWICP